jgi:hypothetical protein
MSDMKEKIKCRCGGMPLPAMICTHLICGGKYCFRPDGKCEYQVKEVK